jgi:hypothetical protein
MSTTAEPSAGRSDPAQLTVLYTENPDGWVTAQIAEYPAAISQGRTQREAFNNVIDALHDLTHEPTTTERLAALVQARVVEPLSGVVGPLEDLLRGLAKTARERGRQRVA